MPPAGGGHRSRLSRVPIRYPLCVICCLSSPIGAIGAPVPSGTARQALIGNAWHAPLPRLLQAPFACVPRLYFLLLALATAFVVFHFIRRIAGLSQCRLVGGSGGDGVLPETADCGGSRQPTADCRIGQSPLSVSSPSRRAPSQIHRNRLLSAISCLGSAACAALAALSAAPTASALALCSLFALLSWSRTRRLADWVFFSFALAGLLLCGLPYIGWAVMMLVLLPLPILADRRSRPRLGGLLFLCLAPVLYAAACWTLLSYLILDDPVFAWRFIGGLQFSSFPPTALGTAIAATGVAAMAGAGLSRFAEGACAVRNLDEAGLSLDGGAALSGAIGPCESRPSTVGSRGEEDLVSESGKQDKKIFLLPIFTAAVATAAAALWFGLLVSSGLDWALPWGTPANLPPPDCDAVARHVKEATPWGRIFVCGYAGLGSTCTNPEDAERFEPCLDPHIFVLRKAYKGQRLYLLVPRPDRENALDPCEWRYGGLYANGAQRLLFDRDFGPWRLFEVVGADGVGR